MCDILSGLNLSFCILDLVFSIARKQQPPEMCKCWPLETASSGWISNTNLGTLRVSMIREGHVSNTSR